VQEFGSIATQAGTTFAGITPDLWALLPEKTDPLPVVPAWPEFLAGCLKYRKSLDEALPGRVASVGKYQGERNRFRQKQSPKPRVRKKS